MASRAHEFPGRCFCAGGTSHQVVVCVVFFLRLKGVLFWHLIGVLFGGVRGCLPSEWEREKRRLLGHVSDFIRDCHRASVSPPGEFRRAVIARHFPRAETRVAPFFRHPLFERGLLLLFGRSNVDAQQISLRWCPPPLCRRSPS